MSKPCDRGRPTADYLIEVISRKLNANKAVLEKSLDYGRLIWRRNKKSGEIEVDLEPKL